MFGASIIFADGEIPRFADGETTGTESEEIISKVASLDRGLDRIATERRFKRFEVLTYPNKKRFYEHMHASTACSYNTILNIKKRLLRTSSRHASDIQQNISDPHKTTEKFSSDFHRLAVPFDNRSVSKNRP
jgi:hypothetical protein